jgi:hypothetical protein
VEGVLIVEEDVDEQAITILEGSAMRSKGMGLTRGVDFVEGWTEIGLRVPFPQQPAFHVTYGRLIDHRCVLNLMKQLTVT